MSTTTVSVTKRTRRRQRDARLKLVREWLLVEENVRVTEAFVEAVFHLFNALHHTLNVGIAREHDDRRVGSAIQYESSIVPPVILLRNRFCGRF